MKLNKSFKNNFGIFLTLIFIFYYLVTGKTPPKEFGQVESIMTSITPTPEVSTITPFITPVIVSDTPVSSVTVTKLERISAKVTKIVDGDTIKIETGETVRFIGIDTPETVDPRKPVQCFAREATFATSALLLGKNVELEVDISKTDRYGRLLRYIWIGDTLINETLVREGFAYSTSYPPDIKYQARFHEAQKLAQNERKGLWSDICQPTVTVIPTSL